MPSSDIKFDLSTFRDGLRAKLKVTKKTASDVLNQAAGSTLANAIRLTRKASKAQIEGALRNNGLAFKLLQSVRAQNRLPRRLQGFTRATHTRAQIEEAARLLILARLASRGSIAAGFFMALAVFRPGSKRKVSARGLPGQGQATRASESRLEATFTNSARGASAAAGVALQQALNEEGRSMKQYAEQKLAAAWR